MEYELKNRYELYIGGKWTPASDGGTFVAKNPATGDILATCAEATAQDVDRAVDAAWGAYPAWKAMGTVRADEGDNLTLIDLEGDALDSMNGSVIDVNVIDFQQHLVIPPFSCPDRLR